MIISHSRKFIFIHIYKVAGSTIKNFLRPYNHFPSKKNRLLSFTGYYPSIYSNRFQGHISALNLKNQLPEKIFNNYYKFAFVRNPWDWQVSLYHYALKDPGHHQHALTKSFKNFDEYIEWRVNEDLHLQKKFIYDENNHCLVDFIGRFENLEQDFKKICQKLNINLPENLPTKNSSNRGKYQDYYSEKSKKLVGEAFYEDIKLFNYAFD